MKHIAIALSLLWLIYSANTKSPEPNKAPATNTAVTQTSPSQTSISTEYLVTSPLSTMTARSLSSGEDGELEVTFQSKGQASLRNKLARGFPAEGPRAIATIAIAVAILNPKKGAASQ